MSKNTKEAGARKRSMLAYGRPGRLEEDQNGMEIASSNAEGLIVEDQNQMDSTATKSKPTIEQPPPKIFKLNPDCFDEIFEYLSLRDLHSFGKTCKTMYNVAGEYFKLNYSAARLFMESEKPKIHIGETDRLTLSSEFNQLISRIEFEEYNMAPLRYFASHKPEFQEIKHLSMTAHQITRNEVNVINGIFPKLETVQLYRVDVEESFYDMMLKHCKNLKRLHLGDLKYRSKDTWTKENYPKLEYLQLTPIPSIDGLNLLLENNPNIRDFSTDALSLWMNRNKFLKSNIKLDLLVITDFDVIHRLNCFARFCDLLNQLHAKGFYKHLHLYINSKILESSRVALASLHGSLEKIRIYCINNALQWANLPDLPNLKELEITGATHSIDMKLIGTKFKNLERLFIEDPNYDETPSFILSFVKQWPKLKILKIHRDFGRRFEGQILKLKTLNEEREKVFGARKLTIYVPDTTFLKTKWNVENGNTNLRMIELKRIGSCKWISYYG